MFGLSFWEIGLALAVALVVLGPKRLPPLVRALSQALRSLQRASSELRNAVAEPLEQVRQPLTQMRDDLLHTVSHVEQQVRDDLQEPEPSVPAAGEIEDTRTPDGRGLGPGLLAEGPAPEINTRTDASTGDETNPQDNAAGSKPSRSDPA